jgi:hypothetical protein
LLFGRIRIRKAQKLTAPDPEHCFNGNDLMLLDFYRYLDRQISGKMFQTNFRKIKAVSETCC